MKEPLKYFLERTTPFGLLARRHRQRELEKKFQKWKKEGISGPMPSYGKQQVVLEYLKEYAPDVFIETGTYKGRMVYAVMPYIRPIYSIELDRTHFENATRRFGRYPDIQIIHGQSGEILPKLLKNINAPCLFWLDAHYSGGSTARGDLETPIMQEIEAIIQHSYAQKHILLIDDARCFIGKNDYPSIKAVQDLIFASCPNWVFEVRNDIIRTYAGSEHV